jgi:MFS family permease
MAPAVVLVFLCFMGMGATISVIPIYISAQLGFSSFVVGLVIAAQYAAMLFARSSAGSTVDMRGPKVALQHGVLFFLLCGAAYAGSAYAHGASVKLAILIGARLVLGIAESYIVTGALAWAIRHVGHQHAGLVMAWNGNAMYGGVAIGAPLAMLLSRSGKLGPVAWASLLLAGVGIVIVFFLRPYAASSTQRAPFRQTLIRILKPGAGLLLATVGYSLILGFANLFFQQNQWSGSFFAIFGFGLAYVAMRIFFGSLPDKHGGVKVACWSLLLESLGQGLLFFSTGPVMALAGAVLSGAGFSLVVPALGVEAVRKVAAAHRGTAMAAYLVYFDLGFGIAMPLAGLLADVYRIRVVYLIGMIGALVGLLIVVGMKTAMTNNAHRTEIGPYLRHARAGGQRRS